MVTSLAFKGETNPAGTPATWVVGHPAARAVAAVEALQPADQPLLFAPLPHVTTPTPPHQAQATGVTNHQLNEFVTWVNDYCAAHGREDGIPQVNGQLWRLSTSQFRRTLAWFIARRPGGSIAGAIAYRHLSVQMFEGYAGTSDSGFRAEVEGEQALAMTDAHAHTDLAGPAAEEAARWLAEFADTARFAGTVLTDAHRINGSCAAKTQRSIPARSPPACSTPTRHFASSTATAAAPPSPAWAPAGRWNAATSR
jgi:hypothetical protein